VVLRRAPGGGHLVRSAQQARDEVNGRGQDDGPEQLDSSAWRSAIRRTGLAVMLVSDTWKVMPIVKDRQAKSRYAGGSFSLNSIPPADGE